MWEDNKIVKGAMTLPFTIGNPCVIEGIRCSTMVGAERRQWHLFWAPNDYLIHYIL